MNPLRPGRLWDDPLNTKKTRWKARNSAKKSRTPLRPNLVPRTPTSRDALFFFFVMQSESQQQAPTARQNQLRWRKEWLRRTTRNPTSFWPRKSFTKERRKSLSKAWRGQEHHNSHQWIGSERDRKKIKSRAFHRPKTFYDSRAFLIIRKTSQQQRLRARAKDVFAKKETEMKWERELEMTLSQQLIRIHYDFSLGRVFAEIWRSPHAHIHLGRNILITRKHLLLTHLENLG